MRIKRASKACSWRVTLARQLREQYPPLPARDLCHLASWHRRGVSEIRTFDQVFQCRSRLNAVTQVSVRQLSRYARAAVSWKRAAFSLSEKSATMRLNEFHITLYEYDTLSTGKLLSNMQRSTPNCSMTYR